MTPASQTVLITPINESMTGASTGLFVSPGPATAMAGSASQTNSPDAKNDSELLYKLILKKDPKNLVKTLEEVDGVYAFCLKQDNKLYLARDIIGVKPLWYHWSDHLPRFSPQNKFSGS